MEHGRATSPLGIALGTILSCGIALADDMKPMSLDQMKTEIFSRSDRRIGLLTMSPLFQKN